MPKCKDCGNTKEFLTAYVEFEVSVFDETGRCVENWAGDRDRLDHEYPPECGACGSNEIEGEV